MANADKLVTLAKNHLEPGEPIAAAVLGAYETKIMGNDTTRNGVLIATDRRVVFFAKRLTGYDMESFPFGNISSFVQGKSMMGHHITFHASGNQILVKWINNVKDLGDFTAHVKEAMNAKHIVATTAASIANNAPTGPDVITQLRQLGELRDEGIVTPAEFEAKKAELLARL